MESTLVIGRSTLGIRLGAVVVGAVLVALAAQVAVPLPGTPVPMTLQPMAVLLVGGLLGARLGALSMILFDDGCVGVAGVHADGAAVGVRPAAWADGWVSARVSDRGVGGGSLC